MNKPLAYLNELLFSYTNEDKHSRSLIMKLKDDTYSDVKAFIESLSEEEVQFLNNCLPDEMKHALEADDFPRVQQLNEVYELL